jgi:hypothetical protein
MNRNIFFILILLSIFTNNSSWGQIKNYRLGKVVSDKIKVDGIKDDDYEWSNMGAGMEKISNCLQESMDCPINKIPNTNCDNFGLFSAVYNDEKLYIYVEVLDAYITAFDGVVLFFSMKNDRTSNCPAKFPKAYDASTFQIIANNPNKLELESPSGQISNITAVASKVISCGYAMEFELDFIEMDFLSGLTIEHGREIGFDIGVYQSYGGVETSKLMWNACCANRNWTEATNFGILSIEYILSKGNNHLFSNIITSKANSAFENDVCLLGKESNQSESITNELQLFPNPSSEKVFIKVVDIQKNEFKVNIFNALSQNISEYLYQSNIGENIHEINTSNLADGIYTVVLSKNGKSATQKLIIKK